MNYFIVLSFIGTLLLLALQVIEFAGESTRIFVHQRDVSPAGSEPPSAQLPIQDDAVAEYDQAA